ncbi:MAG: hypothetical protein AB7P08_09805 [Burkholderiales bacterium]
MTTERTFDVHWEGPYSLVSIETRAEDRNLVLYAVYSTHPLYGKRSLVYIGKTEQGVKARLDQHEHWTSQEADSVQVYAASIGEFVSWTEAEAKKDYPPPPAADIEAIESLLIFAHQPAYNLMSKQNAERARNYRVFNTGKFGSLLPEVSGLYYLGDEP